MTETPTIATPGDNYFRGCEVVEVVDGDTVHVRMHQGFYMEAVMSCRLYGCNAIEKDDPGGAEALAYLTMMLTLGIVVCQSIKPDKYGGRFDGKLTVVIKGPKSTEPVLPGEFGRSRLTRYIDATAAMIDGGYAVSWFGSGPKPAPPWPPEGPVHRFPTPHTSPASGGEETEGGTTT